METVIILSLDLGRYNSVACWYDPGTRVVEFHSIQTTPEEVPFVLTREPVSSEVFEACSQAGWVHDLCEAAGSRRSHRTSRGSPHQASHRSVARTVTERGTHWLGPHDDGGARSPLATAHPRASKANLAWSMASSDFWHS